MTLSTANNNGTASLLKQGQLILLLGLAVVFAAAPAYASKSPAYANLTTDPIYESINLQTHGTLQAPRIVSAPSYTALSPGAAGNPFPFGIDSTFSTPAFADMDNDGDLDMLSGENFGGFVYFENGGSTGAPSFVLADSADNPFLNVDIGDKSSPALVDIDNDGDADMFAGSNNGLFAFFENASASSPSFTQVTGASNPLDGEDVGSRSAPTFGDLDGDGDYDMISGDFTGSLTYFENTGSAGAPAFTEVTGASSPVDGIDAGDFSVPALADVDVDGDLDLVIGENLGTFIYYQNDGDSNTPNFTLVSGASSPFDGFDAGDKAAPAVVDLKSGNGPELISGITSGDFYYLENSDPLPVELTSFSAVANGSEVQLTWTTATELNNAGFDVQYDAGQGFSSVGWVDGVGTTSEAQSYNFSVSGLSPGSHTFRLKQVDFDGAFEYSYTVTASLDIAGKAFLSSSWPNPFNPQATFTLTVAASQVVEIAIFDMQGRQIDTIYQGALEAEQIHRFSVDGSSWSSGKYLIRATGENFQQSRVVTLLK